MEQTARDLACMLQRDYATFNLKKKTTALSNRVPYFTGYLSTGVNLYPNISWTYGNQVADAFTVLQTMLTDLKMGSYQVTAKLNPKNPALWPVKSLRWPWILSLYAYINPGYAAWLAANNITVPTWVPL
jgi:hypothetical protein